MLQNNTKTGTKAVAKITGKGSYKDSVSKYFTIKACSLDGKVQVNLKTTIYTWDGQAKTPAFSIYMPKANAAGMISLQKIIHINILIIKNLEQQPYKSQERAILQVQKK